MSITGPSRVHDDIIVVAAEMTMMSNSLLVIVRPRIDSMVIAHWYHMTLSMHITIVHCTNTRDLLNATIQSRVVHFVVAVPPQTTCPPSVTV